MKYYFYYQDSFGEAHKVEFELNSYQSVMQLLWDRTYEEWGDCKGRSWCGTCHVRVLDGNSICDTLVESRCISLLHNKSQNSRLACQINVDQSLHERVFIYKGDV